jgi:hypothetical protein
MNEQPQQPLSGQQMQAMAAKYGEQLAAIKKDIELRKLALDQACNLLASPVFGMCFEQSPEGYITGTVGLTKAMHAFLVDGAAAEKEKQE